MKGSDQGLQVCCGQAAGLKLESGGSGGRGRGEGETERGIECRAEAM